MKYEIAYDKELYDILSDIQYEVFLLKNKATTMAYDWQMFSFSYNERFGVFPNIKDFTGDKWTLSDINRELKKEHARSIYSLTREAAVKEAVDKFKNDTQLILKGEISIPRYKKNGSFPIRRQQISELTKINTKKYTCKFALLSNEAKKERNLPSTKLDIELKTGNGAYQILDRVISGEYKLCDSRISKVKNKFYFILTYQLDQKEVELDPEKIMGVDIGVNVPAVLAINEDEWYRSFVGDGDEIRRFTKMISDRRRRMQKSLRVTGQGNSGRGRKKKLQKLDEIGRKIHNFKETKNHIWSRHIVNEAVKNGCGTIQMEDLSGVTENNTFLKDWTFYSLQSKIEQKAKEYGIKVVKVKPKFTSQRCSKCGCIDKSNRETQERFKCSVCGFELNADLNAAKNIAMKDIEKIIEEQLKIQEERENHALKYS